MPVRFGAKSQVDLINDEHSLSCRKRLYGKISVPRIYQAVSWISKYWFCTRDMAGHAKPDPGSRFTQKHARKGSQYKLGTSNICVTPILQL